MTPDLFRDLRHRLGLTQAALARELCVTTRTVERWEAGHIPVNPTAARLLILLVMLHQAPPQHLRSPW